jgi:hypothetical protein
MRERLDSYLNVSIKPASRFLEIDPKSVASGLTMQHAFLHDAQQECKCEHETDSSRAFQAYEAESRVLIAVDCVYYIHMQ